MDGGHQINGKTGKARPDGIDYGVVEVIFPYATEFQEVLFRLLIDHMNNVVHVDHTDQSTVFVNNRCRRQAVLPEQECNFLLIHRYLDQANIRFLNLCNADRPGCPQQSNQRDNVDRLQCRPDNDQQVQVVRQLDIGPHAIDCLSSIPIGSDSRRIAAHKASRTIFQKAQAILQQHSFLHWHDVKDRTLVGFLKVLDKIDGVVAIKFHDDIAKHSIVDGFDDTLAHGLFEMGVRLCIKLRAETVDQYIPLSIGSLLQKIVADS